MVFKTLHLFAKKRIHHKTFLDKIRVFAKGGSGGQGHPKFGGEGGRGGHVCIVGEENATLGKVVKTFPKKRFLAESGVNSKGRALFGEPGKDIEIPVPVGIVAKNDAGRVLGEINEVGDKILVAKGGYGGSPANGYIGRKGHVLSVTLDLKLIADIGLVGFPNAGKSTLLSTMSRAAPKIASYPFTTIQPQLGTLVFDDQRQITMADLPGLIEGAHINIGMGHSFLKHIERTKLMLFVVDLQGFRLSQNHPLRSALENILLLNKELELYKEELVSKPAILALNKMDIPGSEDLAEEVKERLRDPSSFSEFVPKEFLPDRLVTFNEIFTISAKQRINTDILKERLRKTLDLYADLDHEKEHSKQEHIDEVRTKLTEHGGARLV